MAAEQLKRFFETGSIVNSVNFCRSRTSRRVSVSCQQRERAGQRGQHRVLASGNINVNILINKSDDIAGNLIDLSKAPDQGLIDAIAKIESVINVRVIET